MERFKEELSKVPEKPGVYLMRDEEDGVLYVGKAVVLKNRLRSYFQNIPHSQRITVMISKIHHFEYIVCDSEYEALLLENNLIKKYKPKYNVLLKDDKGFPYIKVTVQERFPRVMLARKIEKDGAKYFGPYFSGWTVQQTLEAIKNILPLRPCKKRITEKTNDRPCLNYHIGLCRGACCGKIPEKEYKILVDQVLDFLSGKQEAVAGELRRMMEDAASRLEFELAAAYRERLKALERLQEKQKISLLSEDDFDAVAVARNQVDACVQIFFVRGGKVLGREYFIFEGAGEEAPEEILTAFIQQFYNEHQYVPPKVYVSESMEGEALSGWLTQLRGRKCEIVHPQRGDKRKICDLVRENAEIALLNREKSMVTGAAGDGEYRTLARLQEIYDLPKLPERIESYDISNLGDSEINASMVVFVGGKPAKSEYRLFKMKQVTAQSDTDSMAETLTRRFARYQEGSKGFEVLPDLLLIDGGLGQMSAVAGVLGKMNLNIPMLGMVKDDRHRSRALLGEVDGQYREFILKDDPGIWRLVTAVQNETHRVAVSYNRKLTSKRYRRTALDEIKGLGDKRKLDLLRHFGSIAKIREASVEDFMQVQGFGQKIAEIVYGHFHKE
ncbi:MAG: excinuclease ABC subunit UvrC [Clostridia bacterium]|nr:excinuclease ABC subunit UvrC [Clostridia bacterium]